MSIKTITEPYLQTSNDNLIIETTKPYVPSSVKVVLDQTELSVTEIGSTYIQLNDTDTKQGSELKVTYSYIVDDELTTYKSDDLILNRLRELEKKVATQEKLIQTLSSAVDQRVNKQTFTLWLELVQKHLGREVFETPFGDIQGFHREGSDL